MLVEDHLRDALIRLNPSIAAQPDRADDVLYRLRAIVMTVRDTGLVKANEEFAAWLLGERSMPFGENGEHVTIRLIDFRDDFEQNQFVVTQQFIIRAGKTEKRADLVLLVNGMPLVVIEAKTPVRDSESWLDGAVQVHNDYEKNVPELFVPNVFSGCDRRQRVPLRFGRHAGRAVGAVAARGEDAADALPAVAQVSQISRSRRRSARCCVRASCSTCSTASPRTPRTRASSASNDRPLSAGRRRQQIVDRVVAGQPRKGLMWHFQGSGKSLLMLFAARKLRLHPVLKNPTVLVVVDRIDLDSQISEHLLRRDMPNLVRTESRKELRELLAKDVRKVIITTIHKFSRGRRRPQRPRATSS